MDYESEVRFTCPKCGTKVHTFLLLPDPRDPEPLVLDSDPVNFKCPDCQARIKSRVWASSNSCRVEFIDFPRAIVIADPPTQRSDDDEGWESYDPPQDPFSIFQESLKEAAILLNDKGGPGNSLINRMVFAHFIGAFEALLSDFLISNVLNDSTAMKRLIERDEQLRGLRFSLSEIGTSPNLMKESIRHRLRSEMWHNIKKANALYVKAFGIDIRSMFGSSNPAIEKAIEYRHDCVHRNGHDRDGNELFVFTKEYVREIGAILGKVAQELVAAFQARQAEAFFGAAPSSTEPNAG